MMTSGTSAIDIKSNLMINATVAVHDLPTVFFGFTLARIVFGIYPIFCKTIILEKFDFTPGDPNFTRLKHVSILSVSLVWSYLLPFATYRYDALSLRS